MRRATSGTSVDDGKLLTLATPRMRFPRSEQRQEDMSCKQERGRSRQAHSLLARTGKTPRNRRSTALVVRRRGSAGTTGHRQARVSYCCAHEDVRYLESIVWCL